jgi:hypothetical protein
MMEKAKALGKAELSGDKEAFEKAKSDHDSYKELVLMSDEVVLPGNPIRSLPPENSQRPITINING